MTRIAIIDHSTHELYIEDVSDETLNKYGGDEQKYIDDNYTFDGDYSWDYIVGANYLSKDSDGDFTNIDFEKLAQ